MNQKPGLNYFKKTTALLEQLVESEIPAIEKAADICAESIANKGLVFLFGNGHSSMMCEEMTPRQGSLVGFFALVEASLSNNAATIGVNGLRAPLYLENYEGYAGEIMKSFKFGPHDAFIVISNSGIRPVIVEMALEAKKRGMPVIGLLSKRHCSQSKPVHSSGQKLIDVADVVLDNKTPPGDCVVELEGLEWATGPASTVTGSMIMNMLRCEVAGRLLKRGVKPVLLPSHQFVGNISAEKALEEYYEAYRRSLAHLYA